MNYVIIGNSAAAVGCIEGIRQADVRGKITVISDEPFHTYSRPLISYLLQGKTDSQRMKYRNDNFYETNSVSTILGKTAIQIHTQNKHVVLNDGTEVAYDRLLLATGSRPFIPPIDGINQVSNLFTFMKLDDAIALEQCITPDSRVLVVGAGLIGLKCAEGIARRVRQIHVVDLANHILPSILDKTGADMVQQHMQAHGIQFSLCDSVTHFTANEATLATGKKIPFDILVIAVGVRPNTELAADAGIKVKRGIVTSSRCETSLSYHYAAGDCTESLDITTNENKILALLPNAYMQGECAGLNMAGKHADYDKAIPMNAIGFFGLHVITAGSYDGTAHIITQDGSYKKLVTRDNLLRGFIMVGNVERAGIYTALIREKKNLSAIDFDLIKEKPQLMTFSKRERTKTLGGVHK